jgi:26S proteasome regulatory subunit N5
MEVVTKKEYTAEVASLIPESNTLTQAGQLDDALTLLLGLEKKCRIAGDLPSLKEVCLHMVRLCRQTQQWGKLASTVVVINKRRAQSKTAISAVVEEAMTYLDAAPSLDTKIELIKTLKDVCEGKIYVEGESARLHMMLSKIYEAQGDVGAACDMIQDVHIETYGSLSKKEKAEYILEQIRLNLLKKDLIRALIQSRKMNRKTIEEEGFEEIKVTFYTMLIEYHTADDCVGDVWDICQSYYKVG